MGRRSSEVSLRKGDQIYNSPLNVTLPCAWADGGLPRCVRGVLLVEGLEEGSLSGLVVVAFGPHGGQIIEIRVREACQEVLPSGDGERTSRVLDLEGQTEVVAVVAAPNVHVEEALGEWYDVNVDLHGGVGGSGLFHGCDGADRQVGGLQSLLGALSARFWYLGCCSSVQKG